MKNILKSTLLLAVGGLLLTSCDKDMDHNPVLDTPNTFTMNAPAYANAGVDLATSENLNFSWSQPDYGFPAAASYEMQFSTTNTWTISQAQAEADKTGATIANYGTIGSPSITTSTSVPAAALAKLIQQIERYAEDKVPAIQDVYGRVMAIYNGDTIYSNVQKFSVAPYYVELRDADPVIYYLVGGCIADGKWTNSKDAIGTSLTPMYTIAGESYDKVTGKGKIEYSGYFPNASEFKIVFTPGDWDHGICGKDGEEFKTSVRNGGDDPGNIKINTEGYYNIVVNTNDNSCTITKISETPKFYPTMLMAGDFNSWGDNAPMSAISTYAGAANHDWVCTMTVDADGACKFVDNITGGNWGDNWGGTDFPRGTAVAGGANIPYKAGTYKVFFNDILKAYSFVKQ